MLVLSSESQGLTRPEPADVLLHRAEQNKDDHWRMRNSGEAAEIDYEATSYIIIHKFKKNYSCASDLVYTYIPTCLPHPQICFIGARSCLCVSQILSLLLGIVDQSWAMWPLQSFGGFLESCSVHSSKWGR